MNQSEIMTRAMIGGAVLIVLGGGFGGWLAVTDRTQYLPLLLGGVVIGSIILGLWIALSSRRNSHTIAQKLGPNELNSIEAEMLNHTSSDRVLAAIVHLPALLSLIGASLALSLGLQLAFMIAFRRSKPFVAYHSYCSFLMGGLVFALRLVSVFLGAWGEQWITLAPFLVCVIWSLFALYGAAKAAMGQLYPYPRFITGSDQNMERFFRTWGGGK